MSSGADTLQYVMNKSISRQLIVLLLVSTALVFVAACGDDSSDDPAGDNNAAGVNNNTPDNNGDNNGDNNADNNPTGNNSTTGNNNPNGGNNNTPSNNNTPQNNTGGPDDNNPTPGNNGSGECLENLTYSGQVFTPSEPDPLRPDGGVPTTTPFDFDAGLGALIDAMPEATQDDEATEDVEENRADVNLEVNGAVVIGTWFNTQGQLDASGILRANRQFWIQDGNAAVQIFMPAGVDEPEVQAMHPDFNIKVGQKISFTATQLTNFNGVYEVTGIEPDSWALDAEGVDVFIDDKTGEDLNVEDVNKLIRITGTLNGAPESCGSTAVCYQLDHGATNTVTFRLGADFAPDGDGACMTFVGPMSVFAGQPQLNVGNLSWRRENFGE